MEMCAVNNILKCLKTAGFLRYWSKLFQTLDQDTSKEHRLCLRLMSSLQNNWPAREVDTDQHGMWTLTIMWGGHWPAWEVDTDHHARWTLTIVWGGHWPACEVDTDHHVRWTLTSMGGGHWTLTIMWGGHWPAWEVDTDQHGMCCMSSLPADSEQCWCCVEIVQWRLFRHELLKTHYATCNKFHHSSTAITVSSQ